jgi:hypothetical protein
MEHTLLPADVVAVRGSGFFGRAIRFGEGLIGLPNISAHIAMFHHWDDKNGIPWGLRLGRYASLPTVLMDSQQHRTTRTYRIR